MSEEQIKASHEATGSQEPQNDQSARQEVSEEELEGVAGGNTLILEHSPEAEGNGRWMFG